MKLKNKTTRVLACSIMALFLMLVASFSNGDAVGRIKQTASEWTPRERIPGIDNLANTADLIVDGTGRVHAFHSQPLSFGEEEQAIVYSTWTPDLGWTKAIDIILPDSGKLIRMPKAFLDEEGILHLVFYCCDDVGANIFYTSVPVANAANAPAWSSPRLIGPDAKNPASVAIIGDNHGNLTVLYGGGPQGKGIYAVHSVDAGNLWSDPTPIFLTSDQNLLPFDPTLVMDTEGQIHGMWTVNRPDGLGDAIYYAGLASDGTSWREPFSLAAADEEAVAAVSSPAMIAHEGELLVVYLEWTPPERLMRVSVDGGLTWSEPSDFLAPTRGEYGPVVFAVDSNDDLHAVMGDRGRGLTLWHSIRQNGRWQEPDPIVPVGESTIYPEGHPLEFHPTWPRVALSRGNVMLVSWALDQGHGDNGTWFASRKLGTPELPLTIPPSVPPATVKDAAPFVISSPQVSALPSSGATSTPTVTGAPVTPYRSSLSQLLLNSMIPTGVLLVALILGQQLYYKRRH